MQNPSIAERPTVQVQSVIYNMASENLLRALDYLNSASAAAKKAGFLGGVTVAYGDCSPEPMLTDDQLAEWTERFEHLDAISYRYFDANLGSAAGHNRLLDNNSADLVMILNPDVLVAPNLLTQMLPLLQDASVGMVEARQTPIEHPKAYDADTGETGWASTACAISPAWLFEKLNGFDADTFFLYGDDVDYSWRVRLEGLKVIYQPRASVFHDKRLTQEGRWPTGEAEKYYSAEAGLLLPYKYHREDLTNERLRSFKMSMQKHLMKAAKAFDARKSEGRLPVQLDPDHKVAAFPDGNYTKHRY